MTHAIDKKRLEQFIFGTFEVAEGYESEGYQGEAVGIREALTLLADEFGISKEVLYLANQMARENAELLQRGGE